MGVGGYNAARGLYNFTGDYRPTNRGLNKRNTAIGSTVIKVAETLNNQS